MKPASKIRFGLSAILLIVVISMVAWRQEWPAGEGKTFNNVSNTLANVGGYYGGYVKPESSNNDNVACLWLGFFIGVLITLMLTEILSKFEQACNDLGLLRMKYEVLSRELAARNSHSAAHSEVS